MLERHERFVAATGGSIVAEAGTYDLLLNSCSTIWIKAAPGNQELMVQAAPKRFFVPPYVGPSGWVGVWLDRGVDWRELAELLRDSYLLIAPKRLAALLAEK